MATEATTRSSRTKEERPKQWVPPSQLDAAKPPSGWQNRWVRYENRGEDHTGNVLSRIRQGYELVRADEAAGMPVEAVEGGRLDGVIRSGDLVLMRAPVEVIKQRNDYFAQRTRALEDSINQEVRQGSSASMPIKNMSSSRVTRGVPQEEVTTALED